jgi:hypothetical protein
LGDFNTKAIPFENWTCKPETDTGTGRKGLRWHRIDYAMLQGFEKIEITISDFSPLPLKEETNGFRFSDAAELLKETEIVKWEDLPSDVKRDRRLIGTTLRFLTITVAR